MTRITVNDWAKAKIARALAMAGAHRALAAVRLARWAEIWGQP